MDPANEPNPLHVTMPYTALLDLRPIHQDTDRCVVEMPWHERLCTANGILHGGAVMSLADTAGAVLAFMNLPSGATATTTIESKTNLFAAARVGSTLTATAVVLHAGRTTIVVETEVRDQTGRLVAKTTQTQAILTAR
jgi:1,4-dihydroxy-2-naphthoyl-CoA hydrolase